MIPFPAASIRTRRGLAPEVAFPGLYEGWRGNAGKTVLAGEVTAWESTLGSAAPVSITAFGPPYQPVTDGPDYVEFKSTAVFNDGSSFLASFAAGDAFASASDDGYLAACMSVEVADPGDITGGFVVLGDTGTLWLGYRSGNIIVEYTAGVVATVLATAPLVIGEKFIPEMWSDGALINARINGGAVGSLAWVGTKWPGTLPYRLTSSEYGLGLNPPAASTMRVNEQLIVRGTYSGDGACMAWRMNCTKYGYMGG